MITWGSKTGCGQQRESSSNPLHSNPQSVLEQPRNSNSGAKQSTGIEKSMLVFTKTHMIGRRDPEGGQICPAQIRTKFNLEKKETPHQWAEKSIN